MEITTLTHGLQAGDSIIIPLRLTLKERFLLWLAHPLRWPPKIYQGEWHISSVTNGNSFQIEPPSRS
jgi:hypothetical protein